MTADSVPSGDGRSSHPSAHRDPQGCTVVVCRGASCRHAPIPASAVIDALRRPVRNSTGNVLIGAVDCVGPCGPAAVIIVHRPQAATVWVSAGDLPTIAGLATWTTNGGPGKAPMPTIVDNSLITVT